MKNVILELTRIQKEVLDLDTPADQVRKIVDSICEVVGTDVCTLYIADENGDMVMIASHGLSERVPVKIPAGQGLVGLSADNKYPVNVARASEHPNFYYVAETEEERYQSFCGVPLVRYGRLIGVLVVQRIEARALSPEDEAFLVTLSSQLALLVEDIPDAYGLDTPGNVRIRGIKGSAGIGIGQVLLFDHGDLFSVADADCDDIASTLEEWYRLLADVKEDIRREQRAFEGQLSDSISSIFDSYFTLLEDRSMTERVEQEIHAGNWLPGALRKTIMYFSEQFRAMEDPYLRARQEDLHYLGNKLYTAYQGQSTSPQLKLPEGGVILIGDEVSVSDIASVPFQQIRGIVCFKGSSMSHTAILANALGIPAVMGIGTLKNISRKERFIVDGNTGVATRYPSDMLCDEYQQLADEESEQQNQLQALRDQPAITLDQGEVALLTNSGLLADLSPGITNGAQGIGLYRTEIPFMVRDSFPNEGEQVAVYEQVFQAYADKPVYMRTLDIGGDKQLPYFPISNEDNPALGWRGIRFSLDNIQLMLTQVRAMLRAAGEEGDLHILLPMVSASDELDTVTSLVAEARKQLSDEGYRVRQPRLGIMIEVPAAISQIPVWAERIDFISIGSNDLSQYLLALDRNNARVAARYDHLHPAVIHEVNRAVVKARRHHLPVSLCGEMACDPQAVVLLLGMGIRTLSMSASKLLHIKSLIRSLRTSDCEALLQDSLRLDSAASIRTLIEQHMHHPGA